MTLEIKGFWHEEEAFIAALAKGLIRFANLVDAQRLEPGGIEPPSVIKQLKEVLNKESELL